MDVYNGDYRLSDYSPSIGRGTLDGAPSNDLDQNDIKKEYEVVKNIGFENVIWTLYRYNKNNKVVLKYSKKMDLFAITMPQDRAQSELPQLLKKEKIKTYVHTINSMKEYFIYLKHYQIDQIYSDFIN